MEERLLGAIVERAVMDYRNLLSGTTLPKADCNIRELEAFFRSEWFSMMVNYNYSGEWVMEQIRKQVGIKKKKTNRVLFDSDKLISHLESKGITMGELSRKMGKYDGHISWCIREGMMNESNYIQMCSLLNVPEDYFRKGV